MSEMAVYGGLAHRGEVVVDELERCDGSDDDDGGGAHVGAGEFGERVVIGKRLDDSDDVGVLEKDQLAIAVVIGERAERLGSKGDLSVEFEMVVEQRHRRRCQ